ncbi:hypothetical protein MMC25_005060 [Agyrium rufum]|nr:hypothetical protein [Agyrium rufum]
MSPHKEEVLPDTSSQDVSSIATTSYYGQNEPIAIVGMACRLPGGVGSASDLWELLLKEQSGQCDIPPSRFNVDAFYHPKGLERPGSMSTRGGYFLQEDIRSFDNGFFGINNLEATYMDPQQRKLLEVCYECFENAGAPLHKISGANIGCYVGNFTVDYGVIQGKDPEYLHRYNATGMGTTILGNRISHVFNLQGPSLVLDTACSSSIYCLHVACAAIDANECDGAIVAGANLIQSPEQHLGTMKAGVLSASSTCHTFDASADGYGRADGIGALYIKKLSKAIRDNDPIRAIIRGTAVNSNGKTPGITLPSATGQEAVIRKAYAKADLDYNETTYVECHGTGTPVGDPIEVEALSRVFRHSRESPLLIGSVKTNLGHSEAASGISSVIKTVLALESKTIPATIGVKTINPKIKTQEWGVKIVTEATAWPSTKLGQQFSQHVRRAGVNSFGYGGANSHAILESAEGLRPPKVEVVPENMELARAAFLIPLSANSETSLAAQAQSLAAWRALGHVSIVDLAFTLGDRRSRLAERGYYIATQRSLMGDVQTENLVRLGSKSPPRLPLAFVFTGQGAQWPQMGKELIEQFPSFRHSIQELDNVLQALPEAPKWTLQAAILEPVETSQIGYVTVSQPVCTAVQIALVQLLADWGIKPQGVIGHSSGEIGAAYAAGLLTATQAIVVAFYRGYSIGMKENPVEGAMMAVGLGAEQAQSEIDELTLGQHIKVACVNSHESVTISGDVAAVDDLMAHLQKRAIFARKLKTDKRAYHSHHMALIGQDYEDILARNLTKVQTAERQDTGVKFVSSVTGEPVLGKVGPSYWRANLESPVLFSDALRVLMQNSKYHLVEVGPHSALEMPIKQTKAKLGLDDNVLQYSTVLSRGKNGVTCALSLAGRLFLHGHEIDFSEVNHIDTPMPGIESTETQGIVLSDLPPYPWTSDTLLWNECRTSVEFRNRKYQHHDLLGSQLHGGNGLQTTWRNILRVKDVPWLSSHKLEQTTVFPGAGYIAMAIEAICQVTGKTSCSALALDLRHVNILKALVLSDEATSPGVELFTTIKPMQLSGTSTSKSWWEFEITTYTEESTTAHANGLISIRESKEKLLPKYSTSNVEIESVPMKIWYDAFIKSGLNFGPSFQSINGLKTPRSKNALYSVGEVPYLQGGGEGMSSQSSYIIHPITIDAMLQTAIIASTAGEVKTLCAKVPVNIGYASFRTPNPSFTERPWFIDAVAETVGFGSSLLAAELRDNGGQVHAQMGDMRAAAYQGTVQKDPSEIRQPMLRVLWKPDISRITTENSEIFAQYLETFASDDSNELVDHKIRRLGGLIDLLAHHNPRLRILELDCAEVENTEYLLDILRSHTDFKRFKTYAKGKLSDSSEVMIENTESSSLLRTNGSKTKAAGKGDFDLLVHLGSLSAKYSEPDMDAVTELLAPGGMMLSLSSQASGILGTKGISPIVLKTPQNNSNPTSSEIVLTRLPILDQKVNGKSRDIVVVERGDNEAFNTSLTKKLTEYFGQPVPCITLERLTQSALNPKTTVISTIELNEPILSTLTSAEMSAVKIITDNAQNVIWLTGGGALTGKRPNFALVSGLSRALMLEQPSLRFFTIDIDHPSSGKESIIQNLISVVEEALRSEILDFEFVQHKDVLHISRFVPEENMNAVFRQKQGSESTPKRLEEAKPCRLTIETVGQLDTITFTQQPEHPSTMPATFVEVDIKAVGLNAKDIYALTGRVDTNSAKLECSGIITRVGSKVSSLSQGDRVVIFAPGDFTTLELVPEWACEKLRDDEDFTVVCTLPTVFATALYGLHRRANIKAGETVLIHSGAGGLGIAAIQIAKLAGAEVFTTVGTEDKKDFLVEYLGVKRENIFSSHDSSFLPGVLAATSGRGVDIVLNSLIGDLLHDSWRACAAFGRFVEVGKRDITDAGKLDMGIFSRNVTFTAFDLSHLYDHTNPAFNVIWKDLLCEVMKLYRAGQIKAPKPIKVFDVAETTQAFRHFSSRNRIGKVAISLQNDKTLIKATASKYDTSFNPNKCYLMIGCLGGLGRSMAKWMMKRGALRFVFLGRSGITKEPARLLVEDLKNSGAIVEVVRGDVTRYDDVLASVKACDKPLGGVIQAAMGLNEALWTAMSNEYWHTGIDPKLAGSWNIYNACKATTSLETLDFFLMTSSVSGSVGTATESNYCAANFFLDVFARHLRTHGIPAISVGLGMISEVGYLHENPEIEALLQRKGIQAINEDELLQILDICLTSIGKARCTYDLLATCHILTGLEPLGMRELRKKGFDGTNPIMSDPRGSLLASALDSEGDQELKTSSGLPAEVAEALATGGAESTVLDAVVSVVKKRFSNLILLPVDKIDDGRPLTQFGMDSMLAAEFRSWFYLAFKVDIPFLTLLSETVTLRNICEIVQREVSADAE